ncbi:TRAP transporter small permease [Desulfovibrio gilichinskyi]|uniref:TRAP-type C4-dicarboxylate transport system, small permease component n=1 Tax=Desulfovibrio gilichinskyi TaxID=1519643 RepID=A0A1X7DFJ0_9BACT|nr:TRAP transporter small permease [Desulfovibrio gilichinskyi]SMF14790.1 TRAP-type C4-dicarboxylate transport system, small permease component [Desulfovibrio gilichinskyi]
MIDKLEKFTVILCRILSWIAGISLTLMVVLACTNMVFRATWVPVKGTFELMGFFGAIVAGFSLAFSQLYRSHISVGLLFNKFPRPVQIFLDALSAFASCLFFAFCAKESAKWGMFLFDLGEVSETLGIEFYPFVFALAFGCAMMSFVLLLDLVRILSGKEPLKLV